LPVSARERERARVLGEREDELAVARGRSRADRERDVVLRGARRGERDEDDGREGGEPESPPEARHRPCSTPWPAAAQTTLGRQRRSGIRTRHGALAAIRE